MTLYIKKYSSSSRDYTYYRWVIPAVMWENRIAVTTLATGGSKASDKVRVLIPSLPNILTYLQPKEWNALSEEDITEYWTISEDDVIVKGEVSDTISSLFTISDLEEKYDNVLKVTSVDIMDMGSLSIQHFEVGAK